MMMKSIHTSPSYDYNQMLLDASSSSSSSLLSSSQSLTWLISTPLHKVSIRRIISYYNTEMFSEADDVLFRKILYNITHVLHLYLPDKP